MKPNKIITVHANNDDDLLDCYQMLYEKEKKEMTAKGQNVPEDISIWEALKPLEEETKDDLSAENINRYIKY